MEPEYFTGKCVYCLEIKQVRKMFPYGDLGCKDCFSSFADLNEESTKDVYSRYSKGVSCDRVGTPVDQMAEEHWKYTEGLLERVFDSAELLDTTEYCYLEAFKHGFKHGVEHVRSQDE